MGRCKSCGSKGLFLKLKDGYCETCYKEFAYYNTIAPQWLKQVYESVKILNETANPDTFFSRYDFLIERINNLISSEKYVYFTGERPNDMLEKLNSQIDKAVYEMILRNYSATIKKVKSLKTEKAKLNSIEKFKDEFIKFENKMSERNVITYKGLYSKLINEVKG
jgi:hypothetical protein